MYPEPGLTTVHVAELTSGLCGPSRPGHFDGVATVVTKLFLASLPDRAYFGEKDYQQLQVVRQLARDLNLPIEVVGCPTVRESDGLAMSSRNRYLNPTERAAAPAMHCSLIALAEAVSAGADCRAAEVKARATLLTAGFGPVDYIAVVDAESLAPVDRVTRPSRVLAAARTRQGAADRQRGGRDGGKPAFDGVGSRGNCSSSSRTERSDPGATGLKPFHLPVASSLHS